MTANHDSADCVAGRIERRVADEDRVRYEQVRRVDRRARARLVIRKRRVIDIYRCVRRANAAAEVSSVVYDHVCRRIAIPVAANGNVIEVDRRILTGGNSGAVERLSDAAAVHHEHGAVA